jgi:hypothetical protein
MASRRIRLRMTQPRDPLLTVRRPRHPLSNLVYIMTSDQQVKYAQASSCIVYIGRTGRGLRRVSASAAARAQSAFDQRGIRRVAMWPITWGEEQEVEVATKLERARMKPTDEYEWFTRRTVAAVVQRFSHLPAH